MNVLLLRGFWQTTRYTYTYNIIYYLNTFYYPKCFPLRIYQSNIQRMRLVHNTVANIWQGKIQNKLFIEYESPFSVEQNGKICFCIGYFVYEIHGIKCIHVQKPLFVNNVCVKIINIGLKGLMYVFIICSRSICYLVTSCTSAI